jgi:DNA polymerase-1
MAALFDAEERGIPIDTALLRPFEMELESKLDAMEANMRELAGVDTFNPNSSKQLAEALKRRGADLSYVTKSEKTNALSMDEENLSTVDDDLARAVLAYRGDRKMLSTYVSPMLHGKIQTSNGLKWEKAPFVGADGRIHASFNQVGARTGRMSSSDPNVQNFPRDDLRLRYLVKADPGHKIVTADLSSIELNLFAAYVGEGRMLSAILDPEYDPHIETAKFIGLGDVTDEAGVVTSARDWGKKFNYTVIYGGGTRTIRKSFKVPQARAREMLDLYHRAYPEVKGFQRLIEYKLYQQGYVKTLRGRRLHVNPRSAYAAVNYIIQGTAAEMLKEAIVKLHKQGIPIIAPEHDELVAHVPESDAAEVAHAFEEALTDFPEIKQMVPVEAEAQIVDRWSQAKKPAYVPDYARS